MRMPAVFLSHGSPTLPYEDHGAVPFLQNFLKDRERPQAIAVVSAHWESCHPVVSTTAKPETIYDFYGMPKKLYQLHYPAPGAPEIAMRAYHLLGKQFSAVGMDRQRGLDHGAWIPLLLIEPEAQIPVFQISIPVQAGPKGAYSLGKALTPLRDEGVMILGSGALVHNLRELRWNEQTTAPWAKEFEEWVLNHLQDPETLMDYRSTAPSGTRAHPSEEHLLPLFVAMGAGADEPHEMLYQGFAHGSLSMTSLGYGM